MSCPEEGGSFLDIYFELRTICKKKYIGKERSMGRILVFTGKGGVGKTSVAAAHAWHSAKEGKKTLLVSTDMAHNLSDIFQIPIGKEIIEAAPNLFLMEIDPAYVLENDFREMTDAFARLFSVTGMSDDEAVSIPGMDELFALLKIMDIYKSQEYERIIVDCAPTGETLAFLKFPELLSWYMEKFFPVGKVAMRVLSPVSKVIFKVELPGKKAMTDIERMYMKLISLQELLKDREVTSVRLVCMPEKMVVEETKRSYMYMNLYNFAVDGLYINRILPDDIGNEFFNDWIKIQGRYIRELEEVFAGMPVYHIPWFDTDLNGTEGIGRINDEALEGRDIFAVSETVPGEEYEKTEDGYLMKVHLPFAAKDGVDLHESENDVIIKIGNFKRNIPKPDVLRRLGISSAKFQDEALLITFSDGVRDGQR